MQYQEGVGIYWPKLTEMLDYQYFNMHKVNMHFLKSLRHEDEHSLAGKAGFQAATRRGEHGVLPLPQCNTELLYCL